MSAIALVVVVIGWESFKGLEEGKKIGREEGRAFGRSASVHKWSGVQFGTRSTAAPFGSE
jgi:hypothetical protein